MKAFLLITVFAWMDWNVAHGLQSTILADLKQMEQTSGSRIPTKVKRAQEVVMFGNQQNKVSDHNYVRADKRDIPNIPVPDVQNNLEKDEVEEPIAMESVENPSYQQLASLRSKFFYDRPDIYDVSMYEDRQKRNIKKRSSLKRSDRIFRSFSDDNNRIKRESQLNQLSPEEVLSILAMLENEPHRKQPFDSRYGLEYEPYANEILNEAESDDGPDNNDWLDGPVFPSHRYTAKTRFYPPFNNNLISNRPARRFKNNNLESDYARILSQLMGNNGRPDQQELLRHN